jgi:hypothetical protein
MLSILHLPAKVFLPTRSRDFRLFNGEFSTVSLGPDPADANLLNVLTARDASSFAGGYEARG